MEKTMWHQDMTREEMTQLIETFIKKKVGGPEEKKYCKKLLLDAEKGFIAHWEEYEGEYLSDAFKETVKGTQGGKTEALRRMVNFYNFLHENGCNEEIIWPKIDDIGNRYERIVFIMREMQTAPETVMGDRLNVVRWLSDLLWVNERTIEDDFSFMIAPEDRKSSRRVLFKQSLAINGMKHTKNAVQFVSTAHPIFLIENLKSVLVMIQALLEKATELTYRGQAMMTTRRIWKQLTPYAQERISELLAGLYPEGSEEMILFSKMKGTVDKEINMFENEEDSAREFGDKLLYAMKSGTSCKVTYRKEEWNLMDELPSWSGRIRPDNLKSMALEIQSENLVIPVEDIVDVAYLE